MLCGIPGVTLIPKTLELAPRIGKLVRALIFFTGGSLAMALGLLVMPYVTGVNIFSWQLMIFIIALDGIITAILGAIIFSYKNMEVEMRERVQELAVKERETMEMQRLVEASKLSVLQAQINPHFFFNTLNSITALIPSDPKQAENIVEKLADLFRYALKSSEKTLVPFAEELEFVRTYLEIEKLRFGKRLRVEEHIDKNCMNCKIPGLMLQPLVENAIRHGIAPSPDGGVLKIASTKQNEQISITVVDNGSGLEGTNPFKPGHALENIRKRIRLLYGDNGRLAASRNHETGETEMTISIPAAYEV